jgi:hypothetical protein
VNDFTALLLVAALALAAAGLLRLCAWLMPR